MVIYKFFKNQKHFENIVIVIHGQKLIIYFNKKTLHLNIRLIAKISFTDFIINLHSIYYLLKFIHFCWSFPPRGVK